MIRALVFAAALFCALPACAGMVGGGVGLVEQYGDSLYAGGDIESYLSAAGYEPINAALSGARYTYDQTTCETGDYSNCALFVRFQSSYVDGSCRRTEETTGNSESACMEDLAPSARPVCILGAGIAEMNRGGDHTTWESTYFASTQSELDAILTTADAEGIRCVVATPVPAWDILSTFADRQEVQQNIRDFRDWIRDTLLVNHPNHELADLISAWDWYEKNMTAAEFAGLYIDCTDYVAGTGTDCTHPGGSANSAGHTGRQIQAEIIIRALERIRASRSSMMEAPAALSTAGYNSRESGLESLGVCDATETTAGGAMSSDILPGERYVTLGEGSDVASCGLEGFEGCDTLAYAAGIAVAGETLCVRGTSGEADITLAADGLSQTNRTRIIGWDYDGDDSYPPHDTDDIAVLQADSVSDEVAIANAGRSLVEYAHLTIRDYGDISFGGSGTVGSAIDMTVSTAYSDVYVHDVRFIDINRGRAADSTRTALNVFGGGGEGAYSERLWVFNNSFEDIGGYARRGGCSTCSSDFMRGEVFRNNSVSGLSADSSFFVGWKGWGPSDGVIDSNVMTVSAGWTPATSNGATGISTGACSDMTVSDNTISGYRNAILPDPFETGFCDDEASSAVKTASVVITGNTLNMDATAFTTSQAIRLEAAGDDATEAFSSVLIQGNTVCGPTGSGQGNFYSFDAVGGLSFGTGNTWEADGGFTLAGASQADFSTWQTNSGDSSSTAVQCVYPPPVASTWEPDYVGTASTWAHYTGSGTSTAEIDWTDNDAWDGEPQCPGGVCTLASVSNAASLGLTSPDGDNIYWVGLNGEDNMMIVDTDPFLIADQYRYGGMWIYAEPFTGTTLSQWHDWQMAINTTFFMSQAANPGQSSQAFRDTPQFYLTQNVAFAECPGQSTNYISNGKVTGVPTGMPIQLSDATHPVPPGLATGQWYWREFMAVALRGTWDTDGNGSPADGGAQRPVELYNQVWDSAGNLLIPWNRYYAQEVAEVYAGTGFGTSVETIYDNGGCLAVQTDWVSVSIGNNGQAGAVGSQSRLLGYAAVYMGSGDDDRLLDAEVAAGTEPFYPPPGGFPDAP